MVLFYNMFSKKIKIILIAGFLTQITYAKNAKEIFDNIVKSVVFVESEKGKNTKISHYGTGFIVKKDDFNTYIATSYSILANQLSIKSSKSCTIIDKDNTKHSAAVVWVDVINDIALLKIEKNIHFPSLILNSKSSPQRGDEIFHIGFSKDQNLEIINGLFNGIRNYSSKELIVSSNPLSNGMSGGPTLNKSGEVIGINLATIKGKRNNHFSTPIKFLETILRKFQNKKFDFKKNILNQVDFAQKKIEYSFHQEEFNKEPNLLGHWQLNNLKRMFKCKQASKDNTSFLSTTRHCRSEPIVNINSQLGLSGIIIKYKRYLIKKSSHLNILNYAYNKNKNIENDFFNGKELPDIFGSQNCFSSFQKNRTGVTFKLNTCIRAIKYFTNIFETIVTATSLLGNNDILTIKYVFNGVSAAVTRKILKQELQSIKLISYD